MKKKQQQKKNGGLFPNSLKKISECIKTVSSNATSVASTVRSVGASVAASITASSDDHRDQVTWAGFDTLELGPSIFKRVLLLGYHNGFQILDVEDALNFRELVSKRDNGPVDFLQMQPMPHKSREQEGLRELQPLLLVVSRNEASKSGLVQDQSQDGEVGGDGSMEPHVGNSVNYASAVRFYSLRSHDYVHIWRFRSFVCMVRCNSKIIAVCLATQIYCFDALTLESKFSVLTYPVPQVAEQGRVGINIGYGPMALGQRWLAYASNNSLLGNSGRLSPQSMSSAGVSVSTPPSSSSLVARYAMESGRQLASGLVNIGDRGCRTFSRYCQELLPDGSNFSLSVRPGSRLCKPASVETDSAGIVVVKDCVSRALISQFRAHSSPISALCFDPSGTLLVTADEHGNNINIFRIMPSYACNKSRSQNHDWSSSCVHLYKLHRGLRPAIIQDICFSQNSQLIAIVSSKGTCHVSVLSPFGGEVGFKTRSYQGEEPFVAPILNLPWWSSDSQLSSPPPPVSLSVVSRIRAAYSSLLNTSVPSGALVAIFHHSMQATARQGHMQENSLEHLLVYTPSGHVVQHAIQPSLRTEQDDDSSCAQSGSSLKVDLDVSIGIHPVQWWDVCRRSDWPEREESIYKMFSEKKQIPGGILRDSSDRIHAQESDIVSSHDRHSWYLSNAEVQYNIRRIPIWQKSKMSFGLMESLRLDEIVFGETEIEKVLASEVDIRRKDLLPIFDNFQYINSAWNERGPAGRRHPNAFSLYTRYPKVKASEETITSHSKPASLGSTEIFDGSSRQMGHFLDSDHANSQRPHFPYQTSKGFSHDRREPDDTRELPVVDNKLLSSLSSAPSEQLITSHLSQPTHNSEYPPAECLVPFVGESCCTGQGCSTAHLVPSRASSHKDSTDVSLIDGAAAIPDSRGGAVRETSEMCKFQQLDGAIASDVELGRSVFSENGILNQEEGEEEEMLGNMFPFSEEGLI